MVEPLLAQRTNGAPSSWASAVIYVAIIILFLFVNPVLVVLICSAINLRWRIPRSWLVPAFFVSLFIVNRSYGVSWQAGDMFGSDDAPGYVYIYQQLSRGHYRELFAQYEPMLLAFYTLLSLIGASDHFILFMSVMLPISITFYFITEHAKRPYLFLCIILTLFPGWWDIVFHLFRLSLGYSLIYGAIILAHKKKKGVVFNTVASFLSHVTTLFVGIPVLLYAILKKYRERYYYVIIILTFVMPFAALYYITTNYQEIEKVAIYSKTHTDLYFSNIWIVYICIAAFMIIVYKGDILGVISGAVLTSFLFVRTDFSVVAERIIVYTTPLLAIPLYFWMENKKHIRIAAVLLALCYSVYRLIQSHPYENIEASSVFSYIANGGYYNPLSGGLYNLKGFMDNYSITFPRIP